MIEDEEFFAEDRWRHDLAWVIREHRVDTHTHIDAQLLADYLATVAGFLARLVDTRDRGFPPALNQIEQDELRDLRLEAANLNEQIHLKENHIANQVILLRDANDQINYLRGELESRGVKIMCEHGFYWKDMPYTHHSIFHKEDHP